MSFEVSGTYDGRPATVAWDGGQIAAPAPVLSELRARLGDEVQVPGLIAAVLDFDDPYAVLAGAVEVLDNRPLPEFAGDVPQIDPLPEGAIP